MGEFPPVLLRPFHFLIQEHAKCMVAIKELQDQVQALQEFRLAVTKTLPDLYHLGRGGLRGDGAPRPRTSPTSGRVLPTIRDGSQVSAGQRRTAAVSSGSSNDSVEFEALQTTGTPPSHGSPKPRRGGSSKRASQKFVVVAQGKNWLRIRPYADRGGGDSEVDDSDEPTSDSLRSAGDSLRGGRSRRQDSGFSTEPPGGAQSDGPQADRSLGQSLKESGGLDSHFQDDDDNNEDELLSLLEVIESRSVDLRSEVDRWRTLGEKDNPAVNHNGSNSAPLNNENAMFNGVPCGPVSLTDMGLSSQELAAEVDRLRREKEQLVERLSLAEDRALLSHARAHQLEERLRMAATQREQLDTRIHGLHAQFVRVGGSGASVGRREPLLSDGGGSDSGPNSLPDGLLRGRVHVKPNTVRISAVLRETRVLELQRQLLTAIMENEVLKTQLEQVTKDWSRRTRDWQRDLDSAQQEVRIKRSALDKARMELQAERARLRMLQRALQATTDKDALPHLTMQLAQSLHALGQSLADNYRDQATNTEEAPQIAANEHPHVPSRTTNGNHVLPLIDLDDGDLMDGYSSPLRPNQPQPFTAENLTCSGRGESGRKVGPYSRIANGTYNKNNPFYDDVTITSASDRKPVLVRNRKCNGPDVAFSWGGNTNSSLAECVTNGKGNSASLGSPPNGLVQNDVHQRIQNFLQRFSERMAPLENDEDDKDYLETGL